MATNIVSSTIVLEVLRNDNYANWSSCIKNYFLAQDLWDIFEATTEPPKPEDDLVEFKAWRKKNAAALHAIQISCRVEILSQIKEIDSAKIVWDTLAKMYEPPSQGAKPVVEQGNSSNMPDSKEDDRSASGANQIVEPGNSSTSPDMSRGLIVACFLLMSDWFGFNSFYENKENMAGRHNTDYVGYAALYKAVHGGDWNSAKDFLKLQPNSKSAKITLMGKTALHVAVAAGHIDIVKALVELMSEDELEAQDNDGYTALTETTFGGNYGMAECMLRKNKQLVSIQDHKRRHVPVVLAIECGHIKLARYLYSLTPLEDLMPEKGTSGSTLCTQAIYTRTLDIALDLIQRCPRLALALDKEKFSPLYALACLPYAFPSGNQLVFWKRWISSCIHIQSVNTTGEIHLTIQKVVEHQSDEVQTNGSVRALLRGPVSNLLKLLDIEHLYEMKLVHEQSHELLRRMCEEISISNQEQRRNGCVYSAIFRAIKEGIFEFVHDVVKANPDLVWSFDRNSRTIFSSAVLNRQAKIFSLIYGLHMKNAMVYTGDTSYNNILHMAGMSPVSTQLNSIPGAALQMQRELQWFKEVESIVHPKVKEALNSDYLTPRELFTNNHKELMKDGEQWMKDTATSCTVVGALILTIMFAAAFTVPGGNNQDSGLPMFLNEKLFMLFIVSDSLSLFSSATSVLMFLGILTSRYAEEDFLRSLPKKMIIGLSTLFFSIVAMMIAFSAGLLLMLREESWMVIPVICLASLPVTLFVLIQFPLLVDMSISTYGSGIFNRKMKPWL